MASPTITVANGIAEPDLSKRYVLSQGTNLVADNEFNIGVAALKGFSRAAIALRPAKWQPLSRTWAPPSER